MMRYDITTIIVELLGEYTEDPQTINNGLCADFAYNLEQITDGEAFWGDEICIMLWSSRAILSKDWFTHFAPGHCFLKLDGRYYDSECPEGVEFPDDLPYYQRDYNLFGAGK